MSHVLPVHSEDGQGQHISQQGPEGTKLIWQRISPMAFDILERWCFARSQWSLSEELWTSITRFIHYQACLIRLFSAWTLPLAGTAQCSYLAYQ